METHFPFSLLFPFLVFTFMILRIRKRQKAKNLSGSLPPGPKKLPLIGNLHQLIGSAPHHRLSELAKKYGPVMHLEFGELPVLVVSSPEAAKEVMSTKGAIFAQRPFLLLARILFYDSTDVIFSRGDYWRETRKICISELLNPTRVQSFRSIREEEVSSFINSICSSAGSTVNLSEEIFGLTYRIVARAAFGGKCKGLEEFVPLLKEISVLSGGLSLGELFPSIKLLQVVTGIRHKIEKLQRKVDKVLENVVNEHRADRVITEKGEGKAVPDLVDVLLNLQEHGNREFALTTDNIKAMILDIFCAGIETSSTTLEWAMSELVKNPDVLRKAQQEVRQVFEKKGKIDEEGLQELNFLKLVVKETLRLHPPAPLLVPRENEEKCQVSGYDIPAKTRVLVNVWSIGRDPKYWEKAEMFWPERFQDSSIDYKGTNFEFIPFGAGRRMCPGISFSTPNVELPLAGLLYYFDWKVPNGEQPQDLDMEESFGITVRRKHDLSAIPIPYNHLS